MRSLALLALLSCGCCLLAGPVAAEDTHVTFLHTTDVHGSLLPYDDVSGKPANRGLAKVATLVARVRAEGQPVLLLDDGDATSGSPLTTVWHRDHAGAPEPVTLAMNAMGYDAMAVGNHEFDFGPAALDSTRAAASFPFLAANIVKADGSPAFPGTLVRQLPSGVRVGILGLCTPAVPQLADPAQVAGRTFLDPIEVARREIARLRGAERCDIVVVLAHTGFEKDPRTGELRKGDAPNEDFGWRLANEVREIDVLILGHTHVVVPSADVAGTLVTQAGKWGEDLGRVDVALTRATPASAWTITSRTAKVTAVTDSVATDEALAAKLAPYGERTQAALDQVIATTDAELAAPAGRFADNALWQAIHRAQLAATGADVSLAALFDPAQRIPAGPVRVRDLMRLYPYENSLVVVELTGAQLREALEQSARFLAGYTYEDGKPLAEPGMPGFNFDMAYGVEYTVDLTRPAGSRIANLSRGGKPVGDDEKLRVVVNGYRAAGGGDFAMIRAAARVGASVPSAPEAMVAWARAQKSIPAAVTAAWTLLPSWAGLPERALVDRLVRQDVLTRDDAVRLRADAPATRGQLAAWLAAALGGKGGRAAPAAKGGDAPLSLGDAYAAIERAAKAAGLAGAGGAGKGASAAAESFHRGLLAGTSVAPGAAGLTNAQALGMVANLRFPQLRVLETTDFHGAILGGAPDRRTHRIPGTSVALAATIAHYRAENPEGTILLDGGDIFQGTMISNLQFGRPVVEQMNALEYTAGAIGNHDFDWNADTLKSRVLAMRFAEMGANMIERKSGRRPWWVRSDTTFVRRGLRVTVFGLAYPGTPRVTLPANVAHLRFDDDSTTAANLVPKLRKAKPDVVIEVGHIPAETDSSRKARGDIRRLASVPGVDAWLGGHSHNVVDDTVNGAAVMIGGANGQWLAVLDLTVDALQHEVLESRHRVVPVYADDYPADTAWTARVTRWNASIAPIAAEVLGRNAVALDRRRPEATVGDFICDAMRFVVGADIAMQNPGGMRAELPAGEITRGRIYEVMPFDNTIVVESLTGAEVRQVLEEGLAHGRVTQVGGIRFAFDNAQPSGSRVTSLTLADGSAIDPAKTYKVAVNNFMATGGDNYDTLNRGNGKDDSGLVIRGALEAYVREKCKSGGSLEIKADGRITQTGR